MPSFKQIQVGGLTNEVMVGLDVEGGVWYNRGGVHHGDWVKLDIGDHGVPVPNMKTITLWGEELDILEGLDVTGRMWSFAGDLSFTGEDVEPLDLGDWVQVDSSATPRDLETLSAGVGATLFGLDSSGRIWAFDPSNDSEWFIIPLELEKQYNVGA